MVGGQVGWLHGLGFDIPDWLAWGIVPTLVPEEIEKESPSSLQDKWFAHAEQLAELRAESRKTSGMVDTIYRAAIRAGSADGGS